MKQRVEGLREIVQQMLKPLASPQYRIDDGYERFDVDVATATFAFHPAAGFIDTSLEQLAMAIESGIAVNRAQAMLAAADATGAPLPMWLVTGSSVLAAWLGWSRTEAAFRRRLALSDRLGNAPVVGLFSRPTRQVIGQTAARIRVRGGLAVAERVELPGRCRYTATFGREAWFRIEGSPLPEMVVTALADPSHSVRRYVSDVVDHPFFTSTDLKLADIRNDGNAVLIGIESTWGPLAEIPIAAWSAIPNDADITCPWRATDREISELYRLVDIGRSCTAPS